MNSGKLILPARTSHSISGTTKEVQTWSTYRRLLKRNRIHKTTNTTLLLVYTLFCLFVFSTWLSLAAKNKKETYGKTTKQQARISFQNYLLVPKWSQTELINIEIKLHNLIHKILKMTKKCAYQHRSQWVELSTSWRKELRGSDMLVSCFLEQERNTLNLSDCEKTLRYCISFSQENHVDFNSDLKL